MNQRCGSCKEAKPKSEFSPSYRGKLGTWCRSCFAAYRRGERPSGTHEPRDCENCGATYTPKQLKASATFCSRECKDDARNRSLQLSRKMTKPDRQCAWCADAIPREMRLDARFCSDSCNSAAHAATRKAWQRMGYTKRQGPIVLRGYLGTRDGWCCGHCGLTINAGLRYPDPLAPSIDHVIPLSQGGTHDTANLRLVHLRCNCSRRNVGGGEQLALVG